MLPGCCRLHKQKLQVIPGELCVELTPITQKHVPHCGEERREGREERGGREGGERGGREEREEGGRRERGGREERERRE